jgi:chromosome segregation ATPase
MPLGILVSIQVDEILRLRDMNKPLPKKFAFMGLATLALLTQSCRNDDVRNDWRQANNELRQENRELREKLANIDKQLAQLTARFDELQRANETASQRAIGSQITAQADAKKRSEADAGLRADQIKQQTVATVRKIAALMERLMAEIPSLENSTIAWDGSMPKFTTRYKDVSLQMNSLAAELDGLQFARSEDTKLKIAGFSNGYQSLPGVGRLVVSSRERASALRSLAKPSQPDLDSAEAEEVSMTAQLSIFNATVVECKKIQADVLKLAD